MSKRNIKLRLVMEIVAMIVLIIVAIKVWLTSVLTISLAMLNGDFGKARLIAVLTLGIFLVADRYMTHLLYKDLIKDMLSIEQLKQERHNAHFEFRGKKLAEEIKSYDEEISERQKLVENRISKLKKSKIFLTKNEYEYVLEIEKNGFREIGRL